MSDVNVETLAETENYVAWLSHEPDGETVYHLELGPITLHFFREEWNEVLELIDAARSNSHSPDAGSGASGRREGKRRS
ncbi:MAG: hypothetical protein DIU68_009205 [Chloroflexota bacterium]|nr:MAG: hypothetical protein DIU68_06735 [Chloroflexota bacterium]